MKKSFFYFFKKSLMQRKGRFIIASVSVMFLVMVITGLTGITAGIGEKMGTVLKSYGANMVVTNEGGYIEPSVIDRIKNIKGVNTAVGHLIERLSIHDNLFEAIGIPKNGMKNLSWRITGHWPEKSGEVLLGVNLRDALRLERGQLIKIWYGKVEREFYVTGHFEKGGPEDSSILMEIEDLQSLTGLQNRVSVVLIRGEAGEMERIKREIETIDGLRVKTIRQIAHAEESLLKKIQLLMIIVTIVVLFATSVSVASTMGANVLERREEIGLMKALGATKKDISLFYIVEAFYIGLLGGAGGFVLGIISAELVSKVAFNAYIEISLYLPFLSILSGLIVTVLSSYFPVSDAIRYNPAVILRGE